MRVGDWVEVGAEQGYVRRINVRSTEIETFDRALVIMPNAILMSGVVKNWVRNDRVGRIKLPFTLPLSADPEEVRTVLIADRQGARAGAGDPDARGAVHGADRSQHELRPRLLHRGRREPRPRHQRPALRHPRQAQGRRLRQPAGRPDRLEPRARQARRLAEPEARRRPGSGGPRSDGRSVPRQRRRTAWRGAALPWYDAGPIDLEARPRVSTRPSTRVLTAALCRRARRHRRAPLLPAPRMPSRPGSPPMSAPARDRSPSRCCAGPARCTSARPPRARCRTAAGSPWTRPAPTTPTAAASTSSVRGPAVHRHPRRPRLGAEAARRGGLLQRPPLREELRQCRGIPTSRRAAATSPAGRGPPSRAITARRAATLPFIRTFLPFDGEGETANAGAREIGGHPAVVLKGVCLRRDAREPPRQSAGLRALRPPRRLCGRPFQRLHELVGADADKLEALVERNPTTLYIYPEAADIRAAAAGAAAYWDATCRGEIGAPKFWARQTLEPIIARYKAAHPAPRPGRRRSARANEGGSKRNPRGIAAVTTGDSRRGAPSEIVG